MSDTVARIVLSAKDETAVAMASLRNGLSGITSQANALRGAFGSLLPALSVVGAAAYFKQINDGVDAFNDLKDATGASIENISALEDVAARTGTSFDTVGSALIKFNQALNTAKPDSDAALALKAIGLEANQLKKLDPAEALRRTAVALAGYADDGNKARLAQELFGKSLKEVAPLLKDLAEKGELVGKVTTQQAEEAERFNNQLSALKKNATDAGRELTAKLVPALTEVFKTFEAGIKSTDGFMDAITTLGTINPFFTAGENIKRYRGELDELTAARDRYAKMGLSTSAYDKDIQDLQKKLAYLKEIQRSEALAGEAGNQSAAESSRLGGAKAKSSVNFDPEASKKAGEAAKKMAEAVKKANEDIFKSTNAEMFASVDAWVEADFKATADLANAQIEANKEETRQVYEFKDQQRQEDEQKERDAAGFGVKNANELKAAADGIGYAFSSAFENAILDGKELKDIVQGMLRDIAQFALREAVTKPIGAAVSSRVQGIDFGSLFNGFFGGTGSAIAIDGYAGGGYTGGGARSGGLDGQGGFLAMLHPQETVVDHTLPMTGGGGQPIQLIVNNYIDSRTDRREIEVLIDRSVRNGSANMLDQLKRAGKI